jgi:hypothetical protein
MKYAPLLILIATALSVPSAIADITLVSDGKAQAVIIVPEGLYKQVQKSAAQLTSETMSVPLAAV